MSRFASLSVPVCIVVAGTLSEAKRDRASFAQSAICDLQSAI